MIKSEIIQESMLDAEYNVIESMLNSYEKAYTILEYYEGEELDSFAIFTESTIDEESSKPLFGRINSKTNKKENILIGILALIPRLVIRLFNTIKSKLNNKNAQSQSDDIIKGKVDEAIEETPENMRSCFEEIYNQLASKKSGKERRAYRKNTKRMISDTMTAYKHGMRRYKIQQFFEKLGFNILKGGVVLGATGGVVILTGHELKKVNASDFKGKIIGTIKMPFEALADSIKKSCESVNKVAETAIDNIQGAFDKVAKVCEKVIDLMKTLYEKTNELFTKYIKNPVLSTFFGVNIEEHNYCQINKKGEFKSLFDPVIWRGFLICSNRVLKLIDESYPKISESFNLQDILKISHEKIMTEIAAHYAKIEENVKNKKHVRTFTNTQAFLEEVNSKNKYGHSLLDYIKSDIPKTAKDVCEKVKHVILSIEDYYNKKEQQQTSGQPNDNAQTIKRPNYKGLNTILGVVTNIIQISENIVNVYSETLEFISLNKELCNITSEQIKAFEIDDESMKNANN